MRRAPSSRGKDGDALRFSVFDAAHQIGLSDPNALRWLEQNSNISEEDEEEEQPETRPPSDAHPPSLVFSSSSSEPDSSIASPSNDHSTNYRGTYSRNQAYPNAQFYPKQPQPNFHSPAQIYPDSRSPLGHNLLNASNPPSRLHIPAQKPSDPWPPTPLAIASLSPISQPTSRAPTPADKGNIKQIPEPKKSKKLTKAPRGGDSESESVPSRKGSASGASGNPNVIGSAGAPPTLPFLPFPSAISGETLRSDASVSGLSVVSGLSASSSGTVTQSIYPGSRTSNEPRSVFEDDDSARSSPIGGPSGHTHNSPSTSTANSNEGPSSHAKDKEGKLLRTMRSFKLSLKGQKTKANPADAPPVPNVPSLPPVLTLELDKGAGLSGQLASTSPPAGKGASPQTREKEREERVLKIADMFTSELSRNTRSGSESGNVSSVYTTQSHSDAGHGVQSDLGHTPSNLPSKPEPIHASHSDLGHAPIRIAGATRNIQPSPVLARRRSVDESDVAVGEAVKATERIKAGTLGVRNGHTRTRSKSGDFTGIGWEQGGRTNIVPGANGNIAKPMSTNPAATQRPMAKPPPTRKPPKPVPARRFFVTNPSRISTATTVSPPRNPSESSPASPTPPNKALSPTLAFDSDSKHSFEPEEPGIRRENDNVGALEVQHQLQSFVASMRGSGEDDGSESLENTFGRASTYEVRNSEEGSGRGSQDSRKPFARILNDTDTVRSSGEYDPFRAQPAKQRPSPVNQPRPESEALPHQFRVPMHEIPKEISQIVNSATPAPGKRKIQAPPTSFRTPENELPTGLVRTSSISARPSVTINQVADRPMSADLMETTSLSAIASEGLVEQNGAIGSRTRTGSKESELELEYSGFGLARDDVGEPAPVGSYASDEFIVPSPSWAPLDLKRGRSGSVSAIPDSSAPQDPQIPDAPVHSGQFLDVRADRQRASGLSIPRSVTPDSPHPALSPPRSTLSPPPSAPSALPVARSVTPVASSRSVTPVAPVRPTAPPAPRVITPQPTQTLGPQARAASPALSRPQQRDTPSPPLPRNRLPTRTSSVSSASSIDQGVGQRVRSPAPRTAALPSGPRSTVAPPSRLGAAPTSRPSTASTVQSVASTSSLGLPPRSMSVTPTPRNEYLPHEQSSKFLDPESVPTAQQRGRVSPFPVRPLKGRTGSRDQLREAEQPVPTQREKYPGGAEKYSGDGLAPRVRFIGVRSSNGSSQAGWQGRMEDIRHIESPAQSDRWQEEETRPVSWQEFEEPSYLSYDEEESTQGYYEGLRYSAYEDEPASGDATNAMPVTPMDPQPGREVTSTLAPSTREQTGWVLNDSSPASRESTFTLASVYDDEDEDVTPIPKTEKLAAAVRGMGQNGWASGRI
ncbi:unnamed protein product [Rhizoctonia solani]|uniref:Uncharacterized protein n=1 Tax=Rhizoctonia solani TaxID=456999 RepID=A0A8H3B4C1_9AGAM|nr:unnamed protein product [Rhizoctonia solani]